MLAPNYREKGNCIQDKEEGAGDSEKVTHHKVCCPRRLKLRQTVKHIKGIVTLLLYHVMNIHSEVLEPVG